MTVGPARLERRIATGYRQYQEAYLVTSNILGEDPNNVLNASGVPARWAPYVSDPGSFAGRPNAVPARGTVASSHLWRVTVNYSQNPERMSDQEQATPLQRPIEWQVGGQVMSEPLEREPETNKLIINTAGDQIVDPPVERDESRPDIQFTKVYPFAAWTDGTLDLWEEYADALNNAVVWGRAARTLKMLPVLSSSAYFDSNSPYLIATFRFNVKSGNMAPAHCLGTDDVLVAEGEELGWQIATTSNGFNYFDSAEGKKKPIVIDNETPTDPQLLREDGSFIDDMTTADTAYRFVKRYYEKDYSALNLPTNIGDPS